MWFSVQCVSNANLLAHGKAVSWLTGNLSWLVLATTAKKCWSSDKINYFNSKSSANKLTNSTEAKALDQF